MRMFEQNAGQQQVSMAASPPTTSCQFLACYEDSSFIYRHRKRPRSGESPFDSSPASSTTTDSMLTNSVNFSDSSRSSNSSQSSSISNSSSKFLSPPPLTFNLLSTNSPSNGQRLTTTTRGTSQPTSSKITCNRSTESRMSRNKFSCNDENEPQQVVINITRLTQQALHNQELEDERVFHNLILRERRFEESRAVLREQREPELTGQSRHWLLSWMLAICEDQMCQDEIFPLATIILDNFLLINPMISLSRQDRNHHEDNNRHHYHHQRRSTNGHLCQRHKDASTCSPTKCDSDSQTNHHHHHLRQDHQIASQTVDSDEYDDDDQQLRELEQRQLLLFAACSLLLATKLRQTPRLFIQTLIEFSKPPELPIELGRDEIIDGELLMLSMLKWDLAALVTPNEFLQELLARKCHRVIMNFLEQADEGSARPPPTTDMAHDEQDNNRRQLQQRHQHSDGDTGKLVNRHTQALLELCLMDSQLSQYSSSVLAMSSMAVAINGLSKTTKNACLGLDKIVTQIHESTNEVNELELLIDVAFQIEKYVQTLLHSTKND